MGKIICFMGKSASGKDTVFRKLLEDQEPVFQKLVPYTTRPAREGEQEGQDYFFTGEEGYQRLKQEGRIVEERSYHTCHGLWRYFTVLDAHVDLERQNYGLIGTLEAFTGICAYFGTDSVVPVLIEVEDGIRLQRALDRERQEQTPRLEEMCRRFLADSQDFSEEKIKAAGIARRFRNEDMDSCLEEIRTYLNQQL